MFLPTFIDAERNINNDGWWVWLIAVTEKFLPIEPAPFYVPDSLDWI